ncbi:MAG: exodeoxyribonuclease [Paenibacillus sp.]|jgi:exodeoxyribonuclease-3|nr:exodeoxyribonuclease [Paenibacillus sp.]
MKLVSWNVNGLRACLNKGFPDYFAQSSADLFSIQETKLQDGPAVFEPEGYYAYWSYAEKKGYSGTAVFTKIKPLAVHYGPEAIHLNEGRLLALEFERFHLVNVYTPNARRDLSRLDIRLAWEEQFLDYVRQLDEMKPVIICGDLNVAHQEIDLKNAKSNRGNSGFTDEERDKMTQLLASGWIDSFRHLYPEQTDIYSWWSFMPKVRERNIGWRIDYFLVSAKLQHLLRESSIDTAVTGSDHCPVALTMELDEPLNG